jgi:hypothetical protein
VDFGGRLEQLVLVDQPLGDDGLTQRGVRDAQLLVEVVELGVVEEAEVDELLPELPRRAVDVGKLVLGRGRLRRGLRGRLERGLGGRATGRGGAGRAGPGAPGVAGRGAPCCGGRTPGVAGRVAPGVAGAVGLTPVPAGAGGAVGFFGSFGVAVLMS